MHYLLRNKDLRLKKKLRIERLTTHIIDIVEMGCSKHFFQAFLTAILNRSRYRTPRVPSTPIWQENNYLYSSQAILLQYIHKLQG